MAGSKPSRVLQIVIGFAALCVGLSPLAARAEAVTAGKCAALTQLNSADLAVTTAALVPAGPAPAPANAQPGAPPPPGALPEHCLVQGTLHPRIGVGGRKFGMGFELRLPTDWNGRFLFQGGGGLDGVVQPAYGDFGRPDVAPALARGFAVVSTDAGHQGADPTFALDQQARIDYAYNALDNVAHAAKHIVASYYGHGPGHSYFMGCSNGGRQALVAAERLPLLFDGIVAGDPGFDLSRAAVAEAWDTIQFSKVAPTGPDGRPILSQAFSPAELQLVSDAVLAKCDALDGLKDGMINDPAACHFDPSVLRCASAGSAGCLGADKVAALQQVFGGPRDSAGRPLYSTWPYDAGISSFGWRIWKLGSPPIPSLNATMGAGALAFYFVTPPDPRMDVAKFDFDTARERTAQTAAINDATSTFMNSFSARGGRLLLYQGLSDPVFSANDLTGWYDRVRTDDPQADAWSRLFLVPGMAHCMGGPATDDFDPLTAIVDWVEKGHAPDRLVAHGQSFPGVTRPLCAYPLVARYTGGDPKDEKSFACQASTVSRKAS